MPVLSADDLQFFQDNGYVVAKGAVSREQALATAAEVSGRLRSERCHRCVPIVAGRLIVAGCAQVWSFTGMDPDDPETWYETRMRDGKEYGSKGAPGIMVEMCALTCAVILLSLCTCTHLRMFGWSRSGC